jgi:hypothetical protein
VPVKQQLRVFTNISATNKNRQDRAGAEWVIHLAPVFFSVSIPKKTQSFINIL